ncbi:MAG: S-layer protein [Candidatus Altiarchaeota archaeon]
MKTLKRIGSVAAGALMLGSAIAGAVSAGMDDTGMTKNFFYDASFNPVVQIVVGEKGLASDSVAAGNIAAVIGNLAYTSATADATGGSASGQVVLGVSAKGATGKFEQASHPSSGKFITTNTDSDSYMDFYNDNDGLVFKSSAETYSRGEFVSYSLACDQQQRTEAGILKEGTYNNVHCLFCQTLCLAQLENPEHEMEEMISVDYSQITWYEDGLSTDDAEALTLKIASKAVTYIVDTGYVPMNTIDGGSATDDQLDFEWRGKMILFGEEYYVKDIEGMTKVYLAKGKILDDISSEGYTSEYMGYKFKIDHLIYSAEYQVAGILLDVEKPDGTVVQTQISKMANGIVDDIEIAGVYAEEADAVATASIIVYDTTSNVLLEDGKDMELGGEVKKYWKVDLSTVGANDSSVDVTEYNAATSGTVLSNITIQYRHSVELEEGEALQFPSTFKLVFDGFRTNDYSESACSGAGSGDIVIEKEGKSRCKISFTGDDGNRYDDVYMDQGPFSEGDMFILNGLVFEYDDAKELTTDLTTLRLTMRDLLNGGKKTADLTAISTADIDALYLYTYAFESAADNDQELTAIEPDADQNDSDVYVGVFDANGEDKPVLYNGGDLYLTTSTAVASINGSQLGCHATPFGGSDLSKLQLDDATLSIDIYNEPSAYAGAPNVAYAGNSTADSTADRDNDYDDALIRLVNQEGEYIVVDFYDRDFNDSVDTYYSQGVWAGGNNLPWAGNTSMYSVGFENEEDTLLITPQGGTRVTVDWGGAREVDKVTVCQPQDVVYSTIFLGTDEATTTIDAVITKADEGTEKTVGCCSYLVKEFGIAVDSVSAETVSINPIVGNLVVPEIAADTTKNLVVVGGPSVNGLCGLTKDEIQAASGQYVVRKDGSKVYIAGWTAADTVDAGNALIAWLQANVH